MKDNVVSLTNARLEKDGEFLNEYGFIVNCTWQIRPGESLTYINDKGIKVIGLDGYAIIPKEAYVELRKKAHSGLSFWQKIKLLFQ